MSASAILRDASTLASYNVILQVTFRLLTFFLNAFILRRVSQEMLGIVNVRLTLLYSTAVFLAREAFRRACLSNGDAHAWPQTINLLWMTFPLGLLSSAGLAYIWIYCLHVPDPAGVPGYHIAVLLFALSVLLELLSEPLWVVAQAHLFIRLRVVADGVSMAAKCLLTAGLVTFLPHWGLWIFSLAQLLHTGLLSAVYVGYFLWYIGSPAASAANFPLSTWRSMFFCWKGKPLNTSLVPLIKSFLLQSFLKQILTEGEKYIMTFLNILNFADQGRPPTCCQSSWFPAQDCAVYWSHHPLLWLLLLAPGAPPVWWECSKPRHWFNPDALLLGVCASTRNQWHLRVLCLCRHEAAGIATVRRLHSFYSEDDVPFGVSHRAQCLIKWSPAGHAFTRLKHHHAKLAMK
uniref:Protein RFT1 homolog n=1 Tax=Eptatretus burgeri TaxID=7764 RepID=A0A8C4NL39_EPTBU